MHAEFFAVHAIHPYLLLVGLACVPRITLLLVGGPFALLGWLGWTFAPHLTVAIMATHMYWETNPGLCVVAWLFALGGTGGETSTARRARRARAHVRDLRRQRSAM